MAMASRNQVNLDALIPRADLFELSDSVVADTRVIRISDLKPGVIYDMLRKPDFQRETDSWSPKQIVKLIETFSNADIIPSVILWQSGNKIFIVDGAHRLSALVAWVRDDYGAGSLSRESFKKIPEQQRKLHDETKLLVDNTIGPWAEHEKKGSMLNLKDISVQWITSSSAELAADAFIRINQGGTVIDPLEARILRAKRSALSIATRIIARGGTGHEYWKHFSDDRAKARAPSLGKEIYKLLFSPTLELPIKTMDVPLAGFGYGSGALRLSFDLIGLCNGLSVPDSTKAKSDDVAKLPEDKAGNETVRYLQNTRRTVQMILSNERHSLGLHPALYFYTAGGAFQPPALHNAIAWVLGLEKKGKIQDFLKVRGAFETLVINHPVVVKPATHKLGSGARTRGKMLALFNRTLEILGSNQDTKRAWKKLMKEFPHLAGDEKEQKEEADKGKPGGRFTRGAKSAAFLTELTNVSRCKLCGGLLHKNGKVADHTTSRSSGGTSASANARWVHPVCNSNRENANANKKRR